MQVLPLAGAVLLVKHLRDVGEHRRRLQAVLDEYRRLFDTPVTQLHAVRDAVVAQMRAGLANEPGGLMMLPSYVDVLPSGHERGDCYAIDLGGTNLRVAHIRLGHRRGATEAMHIREWPVPEEHFDTDRGTLMRFVARCTAEVVREHSRANGGGDDRPVIGFCFSFPVEQTALDNGRVLLMTKSFTGRGLIGRDVVALLRAELAAEGLPGAIVPAIMNDTVATLVSLRYSQPDTQLGIILGTGTNCAYLERAAAIARLPPGYRGRTPTMVVNTEWADLSSPHLPSCQEDLWIDCSSAHPGRALFEKQISGLYLGEVARRIILRLAEKEGLFGGAIPGLLARHNSFTTAHLAAIDDDDSADLAGVADVLAAALEIRKSSRQQRRMVQEVCRLVCLRSARLSAAAIAGVLQHLGHPAGTGSASLNPPRVAIAIDGSVFCKYAKYRERLRAALQDVCGRGAASSISLEMAQDGSVLGAAYLAVAAVQWEAHQGLAGADGGPGIGGGIFNAGGGPDDDDDDYFKKYDPEE